MLQHLRFWWPSAGLVPVCWYLSCTGKPKTGYRTPGMISQVLNVGERWFPSMFFLTWSRICLAMRSHYWLLLDLLSTRAQTFFWQAPFEPGNAQPTLFCGLFCLRWRALHLTLLNFTRCLWAHFSSPLRSCSSLFEASEQVYPNLAAMGQDPHFETFLYATVVGKAHQYAVDPPRIRDTLLFSATQLKHSWISILPLHLPSSLPF